MKATMKSNMKSRILPILLVLGLMIGLIMVSVLPALAAEPIIIHEIKTKMAADRVPRERKSVV